MRDSCIWNIACENLAELDRLQVERIVEKLRERLNSRLRPVREGNILAAITYIGDVLASKEVRSLSENLYLAKRATPIADARYRGWLKPDVCHRTESMVQRELNVTQIRTSYFPATTFNGVNASTTLRHGRSSASSKRKATHEIHAWSRYSGMSGSNVQQRIGLRRSVGKKEHFTRS